MEIVGDMTNKILESIPGKKEKICSRHNIQKKHRQIGEFEFYECKKCLDESAHMTVTEDVKIGVNNIPKKYINCNFNNYYLDKYNQKNVFNVTKKFAENFVNEKVGMIFTGGKGCGKNHLASAIMNLIKMSGYDSEIITAIKLFRLIKESWHTQSLERESKIINDFTKKHLLIIDEIGKQFGSETEKNIIEEIVNDRINEEKPTILISNLSIMELRNKKMLSEYTIDRFKDGKVLVFDWDSYRGK